MAMEIEDALWRAARRAKWPQDAQAIYTARARLIELEATLREIVAATTDYAIFDAVTRAQALIPEPTE